MSKCPFNKLRSDLPPLPEKIAALPVAKNGYPTPYFVQEINGEREDFRFADSDKLRTCLKLRVCWVCGQPMGANLAFVIGPMCTVNRISADPFAHLSCAEFSVKACPFLARPNMVRREDEETEKAGKNVAGIMIARNPGVMAIWTTKSYSLVPDHQGRALIRVGDPEMVTWWRQGRPATRAEILEGFDSGLPLLKEHCHSQDDHDHLNALVGEALKLLPLK